MGRRSRQRASAPRRERAHTTAAPTTTTAARRSSRRAAAPTPPWGSFPLAELCALAGLALGAWGFLGRDNALLAGAAFLGSVAGLEVALREHLGGYRSHTLVLTGTVTVATLVVLLLAGVSRTAVLTIAPAVLLVGLGGFRELFKRRSGGVGMRVR